MQRIRKLLALTLTLTLVFSLIPSIFAVNRAVPPDWSSVQSWAKPHINSLLNASIVKGDSHGNVSPNTTTTRMEAAILAVKSFGFDNLNLEDVVTGHYADAEYPYAGVESYINAAVAMGIMQGDDGKLMLDKPLTRVEMFGLAINAMRLPSAPVGFVSSFKDLDSLAAWERDIIRKAEAAGLLSGDGTGNVNPHAAITRQEMLVLFSKILGTVCDGEIHFNGTEVDHATVRADGAYIQNLKATTMLITQGVGDGEVTLVNCVIGTLIVRGGGEDKIYVAGSTISHVSIEEGDGSLSEIPVPPSAPPTDQPSDQPSDQPLDVLRVDFDEVTTEAGLKALVGWGSSDQSVNGASSKLLDACNNGYYYGSRVKVVADPVPSGSGSALLLDRRARVAGGETVNKKYQTIRLNENLFENGHRYYVEYSFKHDLGTSQKALLQADQNEQPWLLSQDCASGAWVKMSGEFTYDNYGSPWITLNSDALFNIWIADIVILDLGIAAE